MKALSIVGLVLGILAIVFFWLPIYNTIFLACGIVGIVLSAMGRKKAKAAGASTGLATAGLVLSIIGTCLCGIGFFTCTLCAGALAASGGAGEAALEAALEGADLYY